MNRGYDSFGERGDAGTTRRLAAVSVSSLRRREVVMLRADLNLPLGGVSVLCGQQGVGKGTISTRWAADESHVHGVIFVAEEDSAEAVIKPRLEAAGANLDHVHIVRGERLEDGGVLLPRDTEELAAIARETDTRLLTIDPWTNYVDVPSLDKGQVRQALMPLARIADGCTLAALLNAHPVKNAGTGDPLSEIAHASAVSQIARAAFWVTLDPDGGSDDPDVNRLRLVSQVKANLSRYGRTLRYELVDTYLPANGTEPAMTTVRAVPSGESDLGYRDIRRRERAQGADESSEGKAREWLRAYLAGHGEVPKPEVVEAAEAAGHAQRTVERAFAKVGEWRASPPGPNLWRLRGTPSGTPVQDVGVPGVPLKVSHKEQTPARERAGTPGTPGTPSLHTEESWRTADEHDWRVLPGQTDIWDMLGIADPNVQNRGTDPDDAESPE